MAPPIYEDKKLNDLIETYIDIRNYLIAHLRQMTEVYMTGIWDPLMKFIIIKETNSLIENLLTEEFPDFPKRYLPKVKFRIFESDYEIEAGVQQYLNTQPDLIFLGANDIGDTPFDYYIKKSWSPNSEYMFFARYGHSQDNIYSGAKTAAAEYFQGAMTPLSVAFGMAVEDGFIA